MPAGTTAAALADASLATQARELSAFRTIDRATATLAGGEAVRTLAHHEVAEVAVTLEEWRLVAAGSGYTVTASCWTLDYPSVADAFTAAAESLEPATPPD